jgi:hypothetical protein
MLSKMMSRTIWLLATVVCMLAVIAVLTFTGVIWVLAYFTDRAPAAPRSRRKRQSVGRSRVLIPTSLNVEPDAS